MQVLDKSSTVDDLISQHEFLMFMSIKRNDDLDPQKDRSDALGKQLKTDIELRRHQRKSGPLAGRMYTLLMVRVRAAGDWLRTVYLDRLPPLGKFGQDGLGEEHARNLQRIVFSNTFWCFEVTLIFSIP